MSKRNNRLLLLDIIESIDKIFEYTIAHDYKSFSKDSKTIDAVVRNFEIIGEATNHISQKLRNNYDLPWDRIIGLRNVIIHENFGVDTKIIWKIIKRQLSILKKQIEKILNTVES